MNRAKRRVTAGPIRVEAKCKAATSRTRRPDGGGETYLAHYTPRTGGNTFPLSPLSIGEGAGNHPLFTILEGYTKHLGIKLIRITAKPLGAAPSYPQLVLTGGLGCFDQGNGERCGPSTHRHHSTSRTSSLRSFDIDHDRRGALCVLSRAIGKRSRASGRSLSFRSIDSHGECPGDVRRMDERDVHLQSIVIGPSIEHLVTERTALIDT